MSENDQPTVIGPTPRRVHEYSLREISDVAEAMMSEWRLDDPRGDVARRPDLYIEIFVRMARVALKHIEKTR
tara:strand:- start:278 stop:493 length:216 start_codon:yes stop_codon:yes gene_type:complete